MDSSKHEKLEVPSAESQALRREAFVEKLLNPGKPLVKTMKQSSDILNQVKAFMPRIKSANEDLEKMDKTLVQIDEPPEGEPYVEMNVQLYEDSNSGTSDSDTDSTNSTVSPDGSSSAGSEDGKDSSDDDDRDQVPQKQLKLISEVSSSSAKDGENST